MNPFFDIVEQSFVRAPWGWALTFAVIAALIKAWPALKSLQIGEHAQIRSEYVAEIKALREEVRGLRIENGELRDEIRQLHDDLAGFRRGRMQGQVSIVRAMTEVPADIADAAERAQAALDGLDTSPR